MGEADRDYRFLTPFDGEFPEKLKSIPQPPKGIYVRGGLPDPDIPSVAIIGARTNTEYGRRAAQVFASKLSTHGVQIISGMARGIDGIAQEAAIRAGGLSFGVLGCGLNVVYPRENKELYGLVASHGGLISEYEPDMEARRELFPQRNRLIAGLCDILLVIEARFKSGTSITVRFALEQGKDVFALPGRVSDPLSVGCNALIADGAGVASCPEDILQALGLIPRPKNKKIKVLFKNSLKGMSPELVNIMQCMDYSPVSVNELLQKTGLGMPCLMEKLLELEIEGYIKRCGAAHYIKKV